MRKVEERGEGRGETEIEVQLYPFFNLGSRRGWSKSGPPLYPGTDPVSIVQENEWAHSRSGWMRNTSLPQGFEHRTAQHVARHYTDYATSVACQSGSLFNKMVMLWAGQPGIWGSVLMPEVLFSRRVRTWPGAHPTRYPLGPRECFLGTKATGMCGCPVTPR